MKTTTRILCVAGLLMAGCSSAPKGPSAEELMAAAHALDQQFIEAYNNGDADALMQLYWNSPELDVFTPGEMVLQGYDAVRESFEKGLSMDKGSRLELKDPKNTVFGDVVLGHGTWTWHGTLPNGESITSEGRYTDLKVMVDGKMVYVSDHASVPMSAPEPPAMPADSAAGDAAAM